MKETIAEFVVSAGASTAVCTGVDASPLLTAIITFGISIVSIVGGELIKYLIAYFKNKTAKLDKDTKKTEEDKDVDN